MTNYFDDGINQQCGSCHYSCYTCTDTNVCTSCPSTRTLSGSTCPCNNGYYDAGVATCSSCHYSCFLCDNSSTCTSCNTTFFRTMNTTTYLCDCIIGYYDISSTQTCGACHTTCYTCLDGNINNCTSCLSSNGR